jgi:heme exporter protein D
MGRLGDYLAMGGYAHFVWPAYGVVLIVLGGFALHAWRRYRASLKALDELQPQMRVRR